MINMVKLPTKKSNLFLRVAKGHFATSHSHINYYIDVTLTKFRLSEARAAAAELVRAIRGADKANIVDARLFDRFTGQGVPEGQVSLAVEVELQPVEKSVTDAELKAIADKVVAAAAKVGAVLRG